MTKQFWAYLLFLSPVWALAQKKDKKIEKIAKTISASSMRQHLNIIAGPEMEGRNTPSAGLEKAANYIEENFKSLGLLPGNSGSYRQLYSLYKDSTANSSLKVNGNAFEINKDYLPHPNNFTAQMRFSELVFVGYGISDGSNRDDYKDVNVAGKLVMILDGSPIDYKPSKQGFNSPASSFSKVLAAREKGAAGLLIVTENFPSVAKPFVSNWNPSAFKATQALFAFNISTAVAKSIMSNDTTNLFDTKNNSSIVVKTYAAKIELSLTKELKSEKASNVLAVLEGTDKKDEYVFITAHYDHLGKQDNGTIFFGADDDGSGTTGVLELAKAFAEAKKNGKPTRRSIVFMTISGEEKGLWGSEYYAANPIFPLEKTTVDLNIDMIGRTGKEYLKDKDSVSYVYIVGDDKLSSDLTPITEKVNKTYSRLKLDRKYNDPKDTEKIYYRSDHYNFAEKGVPIIFYFNGVHADYHKPTDTPDKINYMLMAKRTQLIFYTAWEMANRNDMLKRDLKLEKKARH